MKKYGPAHLTVLLVIAVGFGWLTGCKPENGQPDTCKTNAQGQVDCPMRTANQPGVEP